MQMFLSRLQPSMQCGRVRALKKFNIGACSSRSLATLKEKESNFRIHPDVSQAVKNNSPVVALESTIITHGMPYPENYRTALEVENIIREKGVVPATIAVINGMIHVGLTKDDLLDLSTSKSSLKISRRDLSPSIAFGQTGGTTVSATMLIAHWCGIPIFVTGGVGGVHRGAESTMDVSSDLTELGRTPITVVSAGVKSILDIPKTLEYLETQGVTVVTYGDTNDFPAFFTPKSGYQSQSNVNAASEAAKLIKASRDLKMNSGCLIAAPIPEKHAASGYMIEDAIQKSLMEAKSLSISGAEVTPFILQKVNEITGGESLKANVALIKHNAEVGADIALELSRITTDKAEFKGQRGNRPVVIGATNIDIISKTSSDVLYNGPSNPAEISCTLGGVGCNIAENLSRTGNNPIFLTLLGDDKLGKMAESEMGGYLDTSYTRQILDKHSGMYVAIMDKDGSLRVGTENLSINDRFTSDIIQANEDLIGQAPLVCIDANLPERTISYICELCERSGTELFFEPTGSLKAHRPFTGNAWKAITYLTPNIQEFQVIMSAISGKKSPADFDENLECSEKMLQSILSICPPLVEHINCLVVTLAKYGVATFIQDESQRIIGRHYPLTSMPNFEFLRQPIVNVSGSGDSFAASFIHGLLEKQSIDASTKMGLVAAQVSLRAHQAVSPSLSSKIFEGVEELDWKSYPIHGKCA